MANEHFSDVSLSAKGLMNIPRTIIDHDYTFIVGSTRYECPLFVACLLSPRISSILVTDPTMREFVIETEDASGYFGEFLSLGWGSTLEVSAGNRNRYFQFLGELWNRELFESQAGNSLTRENAIDRLLFAIAANAVSSADIDFCASHFFELDITRANSLDLKIVLVIISNSSLESIYSVIGQGFTNRCGGSSLDH